MVFEVRKLLSIVIPTRNEPLIEELIAQIKKTMKTITDDYEILAVDKSEDDTAHKLRNLNVKVIDQHSKGLGGAILEGLAAAQGNPVIVMDADLSHDPKFIPTFLEKSSEGFDIVIGSRRIKGGGIVGWGIYRKAVSGVGNLLGRRIAGIRVSDMTSGYRLYSHEVIKTLEFQKFRSSGYAFQLEVLAEASRKEFRIGAVPIVFHDRVEGVSKLTKKDVLGFALTVTWLGLLRLINAFRRPGSIVQNRKKSEE